METNFKNVLKNIIIVILVIMVVAGIAPYLFASVSSGNTAKAEKLFSLQTENLHVKQLLYNDALEAFNEAQENAKLACDLLVATKRMEGKEVLNENCGLGL